MAIPNPGQSTPSVESETERHLRRRAHANSVIPVHHLDPEVAYLTIHISRAHTSEKAKSQGTQKRNQVIFARRGHHHRMCDASGYISLARKEKSTINSPARNARDYKEDRQKDPPPKQSHPFFQTSPSSPPLRLFPQPQDPPTP